jgi:hypothetical protein
MKTDAEIEAFHSWCSNHAVKAVQGSVSGCYLLQCRLLMTCADWYENKVRHRWYLPSLNRHLSRIRRDHWALVPKNAHAHTNFYTGTGHSLLSEIDA